MTQIFDHTWLLPFLLYAETHYRFKYFFSLLSKSEPEILADAPHRLEPGHKLPILILVKDAHIFPCRLLQIKVTILNSQNDVHEADLLDAPLDLRGKWFSRVFSLELPPLVGWIDVDVRFTVEREGKPVTYHNDNHRTSSRKPLRIFVSAHQLPRFPTLYLGDPHTHSEYTEDQVEFGSPIDCAVQLSEAMGLSYFCVTDHSYDLDNRIDSYLENDPDLARWDDLQKEVNELNEGTDSFVVVRGEEVSCRNSRGQNVHLLLFGQTKFIPGSGDSAERWLRTRSEHTIPEVLGLRSSGSVAYAAHAMERVSLLQRILLRRGCWGDLDLACEGLSGFQIINGELDKGFQEGYQAWIRLLLRGHHVIAIAGNDAHGNFNRFRQIGVPFIAIKETNHQVFGRMRTGVYVEDPFTEMGVLKAFAEGSIVVTDGPVARLASKAEGLAGTGSRPRSASIDFSLEALSSPEFGALISVRIIVGKAGDSTEQVAYRSDGVQGYAFRKELSVKRQSASYVRAEVWTSSENLFDHRQHLCLTNPIWTSAVA